MGRRGVSARSLGIAMTALVLAAAPIMGQSEHDPARAETAFQEAVKLRNQGDLVTACPLFLESQRLDPARGTLLNIAMCHEALGQLAPAWAAYRQLADESAVAGDTERLELARSALERLEPQLPRLIVEVPPPARIDGLQVRAGDTLVAPELYGVRFPIDLGTCTITAEAPDHETWQTRVEAHLGEETTVEIPPLRPTPIPPSPDPQQPSAAVDLARPSPAWPSRRKWALPAAGVALVGLGAGSYFGLVARDQWNDAAEHCNENRSLCNATGRRLIGDAKDSATYSNLAFGVAAVAGASAAYLWLTASPRRSATQSAWRLAPRFDRRAVAVTASHAF